MIAHRTLFLRIWLTFVSLTMLRCSSDDSQFSALPGEPGMPAPMSPPLFHASSTVGRDGGTLHASFRDREGQSYDVIVQIPAQALHEPTEITLTSGPELARKPEKPVGPALRLLPVDLVLEKPFLLTLRFDPSHLAPNEELALATLQAGLRDTAALSPATRTRGEALIEQMTLGSYQIIATGNVMRAMTQTLDILFMIDNSPSMAPKQQALAANIPKFIQRIEQITDDYHIGIITSDIGSTMRPGHMWGTGNIGSCDTFNGDDGALQAVDCNSRTDISSEAKTACKQLCPDGSFVPNDSHHFISKVGGVTNVPVARQEDPPMSGKFVDKGPARAFQCMALVGDGGCGMEGQLEAVNRALAPGYRSENADFLRTGSLLAVIYITDEDDCSIKLSRRNEADPAELMTMTEIETCKTADKNANFKCFNVDYRCFANSVTCKEELNTPGIKSKCEQKADSFLTPVATYVKTLTTLRPDPRLRLVSGIWTLPDVKYGGGAVKISDEGVGMTSRRLNRATGTEAACFDPDPNRPPIFGQPQLRLSDFACSLNGSYQVSVCDIGAYQEALYNIAEALNKMTKGSIAGNCP